MYYIVDYSFKSECKVTHFLSIDQTFRFFPHIRRCVVFDIFHPYFLLLVSGKKRPALGPSGRLRRARFLKLE